MRDTLHNAFYILTHRNAISTPWDRCNYYPQTQMGKPRHGKVQELSVVTLVVSGRAGIWSPVPESTPLATALCWGNLFCHKTWPEWHAGNNERAPSQGRESTWVRPVTGMRWELEEQTLLVSREEALSNGIQSGARGSRANKQSTSRRLKRMEGCPWPTGNPGQETVGCVAVSDYWQQATGPRLDPKLRWAGAQEWRVS